MNRKSLIIAMLTVPAIMQAQEFMRVHLHQDGESWKVPFRIEQVDDNVFDDAHSVLSTRLKAADGAAPIAIPFAAESIDSITFVSSLADADKGHNKYRVFTMNITTEGMAPLDSKEEWVNCHIAIDGRGEYSDYSGTGRIRGRGNSTWEWYPKKPYKFKLDEKSKILGLSSAARWNLLANYRDVTDMMNVFAFEAARYMGLPHTNHTRFVEVRLNGDYVGVYQLTEKIEINKNRIDIPQEGGVLLSLDQDDGPTLSPFADDNFWTEVYALPMCVKEPEHLSAEELLAIRADFAELERAVKSRDYAKVDELMDVSSFISVLQLHEFLYNVEIDAPRSLYLYKAKDGKYTFGPVWDWDAGYDFDWSDMYTGHTFFGNYTKTIYGYEPLDATGAYYHINKFFRDMFGNATFVSKYKEQWQSVSDSIFIKPWSEVERYVAEMDKGAYSRDIARWPLKNTNGWGVAYFDPTEEIAKMREWISIRKELIDALIELYPAGTDEIVENTEPVVVVGAQSITVKLTCQYKDGYQQGGRIKIPEDAVKSLLGGAPTRLIPLNSDGTEGNNTAAGRYGAWFDKNGDTNPWAVGHVYIESDDLYSWAYGCHPDNCDSHDGQHTATMQYIRGSKKLNVTVTFQMR